MSKKHKHINKALVASATTVAGLSLTAISLNRSANVNNYDYTNFFDFNNKTVFYDNAGVLPAWQSSEVASSSLYFTLPTSGNFFDWSAYASNQGRYTYQSSYTNAYRNNAIKPDIWSWNQTEYQYLANTQGIPISDTTRVNQFLTNGYWRSRYTAGGALRAFSSNDVNYANIQRIDDGGLNSDTQTWRVTWNTNGQRGSQAWNEGGMKLGFFYSNDWIPTTGNLTFILRVAGWNQSGPNATGVQFHLNLNEYNNNRNFFELQRETQLSSNGARNRLPQIVFSSRANGRGFALANINLIDSYSNFARPVPPIYSGAGAGIRGFFSGTTSPFQMNNSAQQGTSSQVTDVNRQKLQSAFGKAFTFDFIAPPGNEKYYDIANSVISTTITLKRVGKNSTGYDYLKPVSGYQPSYFGATYKYNTNYKSYNGGNGDAYVNAYVTKRTNYRNLPIEINSYKQNYSNNTEGIANFVTPLPNWYIYQNNNRVQSNGSTTIGLNESNYSTAGTFGRALNSPIYGSNLTNYLNNQGQNGNLKVVRNQTLNFQVDHLPFKDPTKYALFAVPRTSNRWRDTSVTNKTDDWTKKIKVVNWESLNNNLLVLYSSFADSNTPKISNTFIFDWNDVQKYAFRINKFLSTSNLNQGQKDAIMRLVNSYSDLSTSNYIDGVRSKGNNVVDPLRMNDGDQTKYPTLNVNYWRYLAKIKTLYEALPNLVANQDVLKQKVNQLVANKNTFNYYGSTASEQQQYNNAIADIQNNVLNSSGTRAVLTKEIQQLIFENQHLSESLDQVTTAWNNYLRTNPNTTFFAPTSTDSGSTNYYSGYQYNRITSILTGNQYFDQQMALLNPFKSGNSTKTGAFTSNTNATNAINHFVTKFNDLKNTNFFMSRAALNFSLQPLIDAFNQAITAKNNYYANWEIPNSLFKQIYQLSSSAQQTAVNNGVGTVNAANTLSNNAGIVYFFNKYLDSLANGYSGDWWSTSTRNNQTTNFGYNVTLPLKTNFNNYVTALVELTGNIRAGMFAVNRLSQIKNNNTLVNQYVSQLQNIINSDQYHRPNSSLTKIASVNTRVNTIVNNALAKDKELANNTISSLTNLPAALATYFKNQINSVNIGTMSNWLNGVNANVANYSSDLHLSDLDTAVQQNIALATVANSKIARIKQFKYLTTGQIQSLINNVTTIVKGNGTFDAKTNSINSLISQGFTTAKNNVKAKINALNLDNSIKQNYLTLNNNAVINNNLSYAPDINLTVPLVKAQITVDIIANTNNLTPSLQTAYVNKIKNLHNPSIAQIEGYHNTLTTTIIDPVSALNNQYGRTIEVLKEAIAAMNSNNYRLSSNKQAFNTALNNVKALVETVNGRYYGKFDLSRRPDIANKTNILANALAQLNGYKQLAKNKIASFDHLTQAQKNTFNQQIQAWNYSTTDQQNQAVNDIVNSAFTQAKNNVKVQINQLHLPATYANYYNNKVETATLNNANNQDLDSNLTLPLKLAQNSYTVNNINNLSTTVKNHFLDQLKNVTNANNIEPIVNSANSLSTKYQQLQAVVNNANSLLTNSNYLDSTPSVKTAFDRALATAKGLYNNNLGNNSNITNVDNALNNLNAAIINLDGYKVPIINTIKNFEYLNATQKQQLEQEVNGWHIANSAVNTSKQALYNKALNLSKANVKDQINHLTNLSSANKTYFNGLINASHLATNSPLDSNLTQPLNKAKVANTISGLNNLDSSVIQGFIDQLKTSNNNDQVLANANTLANEYTKLQTVLNQAQDIKTQNLPKYQYASTGTNGAKTIFDNALDAANRAFTNQKGNNNSLTAVTKLFNDLTNAIEGLNGVVAQSQNALKEAIAKATDYNDSLTDYPNIKKHLTEAINQAKAVEDSDNPDTLNKATKALNDALENAKNTTNSASELKDTITKALDEVNNVTDPTIKQNLTDAIHNAQNALDNTNPNASEMNQANQALKNALNNSLHQDALNNLNDAINQAKALNNTIGDVAGVKSNNFDNALRAAEAINNSSSTDAINQALTNLTHANTATSDNIEAKRAALANEVNGLTHISAAIKAQIKNYINKPATSLPDAVSAVNNAKELNNAYNDLNNMINSANSAKATANYTQASTNTQDALNTAITDSHPYVTNGVGKVADTSHLPSLTHALDTVKNITDKIDTAIKGLDGNSRILSAKDTLANTIANAEAKLNTNGLNNYPNLQHQLEQAINTAKQVLNSQNLNDINQANTNLTNAMTNSDKNLAAAKTLSATIAKANETLSNLSPNIASELTNAINNAKQALNEANANSNSLQTADQTLNNAITKAIDDQAAMDNANALDKIRQAINQGQYLTDSINNSGLNDTNTINGNLPTVLANAKNALANDADNTNALNAATKALTDVIPVAVERFVNSAKEALNNAITKAQSVKSTIDTNNTTNNPELSKLSDALASALANAHTAITEGNPVTIAENAKTLKYLADQSLADNGLIHAIENATNYANTTLTPSDNPEQYNSIKETLENAINAAKAVLDDPSSTADQINQATNTLNQALEASKAAKAEQDALALKEAKNKINTAIDNAKKAIATIGNNPVLGDLPTALTNAENALDDSNNPAYNNTNKLNDLTQALNEATEKALADNAKYLHDQALQNLKNTLDQANNDVPNIHNATIKQQLNDAITKANAVYNNPNSSTEAINEANSTLTNALDHAKNLDQALNNLEHQIAIANNLNHIIGNNGLKSNDFDQALATANNVNNPNSTIEEVNNASAALEQANNKTETNVIAYKQATVTKIQDLTHINNELKNHYIDQVNNTDTTIDQVNTALANATKLDEAYKKLKDALTTTYDSNIASNNYTQATNQNVYTDVVNKTKAKYLDNNSLLGKAFETDTDTTVNNINDAIDALNNAYHQLNGEQNIANSLRDLNNALDQAKDLHTEIATNPLYSDIASTLQNAIDKANDSLTSVNVQAINNATKELTNAINDAKENSLKAQINKAKEVLNDTLANNPLYAKVKQELNKALEKAKTVYSIPNNANNDYEESKTLAEAITNALNNKNLIDATNALNNVVEKAKEAVSKLSDPIYHSVVDTLNNALTEANDVLTNNTDANNPSDINNLNNETKKLTDVLTKALADAKAINLAHQKELANNAINALTHIDNTLKDQFKNQVATADNVDSVSSILNNAQALDGAYGDLADSLAKADNAKTTIAYTQATNQDLLNNAINNAKTNYLDSNNLGTKDNIAEVNKQVQAINDAIDALNGDEKLKADKAKALEELNNLTYINNAQKVALGNKIKSALTTEDVETQLANAKAVNEAMKQLAETATMVNNFKDTNNNYKFATTSDQQELDKELNSANSLINKDTGAAIVDPNAINQINSNLNTAYTKADASGKEFIDNINKSIASLGGILSENAIKKLQDIAVDQPNRDSAISFKDEASNVAVAATNLAHQSQKLKDTVDSSESIKIFDTYNKVDTDVRSKLEAETNTAKELLNNLNDPNFTDKNDVITKIKQLTKANDSIINSLGMLTAPKFPAASRIIASEVLSLEDKKAFVKQIFDISEDQDPSNIAIQVKAVLQKAFIKSKEILQNSIATNSYLENYKQINPEGFKQFENNLNNATLDDNSTAAVDDNIFSIYNKAIVDDAKQNALTTIANSNNLTPSVKESLTSMVNNISSDNINTKVLKETTLNDINTIATHTKDLNDVYGPLITKVNQAIAAKATINYTNASSDLKTNLDNILSDIEANLLDNKLGKLDYSEANITTIKAKYNALTTAIDALNGQELLDNSIKQAKIDLQHQYLDQVLTNKFINQIDHSTSSAEVENILTQANNLNDAYKQLLDQVNRVKQLKANNDINWTNDTSGNKAKIEDILQNTLANYLTNSLGTSEDINQVHSLTQDLMNDINNLSASGYKDQNKELINSLTNISNSLKEQYNNQITNATTANQVETTVNDAETTNQDYAPLTKALKDAKAVMTTPLFTDANDVAKQALTNIVDQVINKTSDNTNIVQDDLGNINKYNANSINTDAKAIEDAIKNLDGNIRPAIKQGLNNELTKAKDFINSLKDKFHNNPINNIVNNLPDVISKVENDLANNDVSAKDYLDDIDQLKDALNNAIANNHALINNENDLANTINQAKELANQLTNSPLANDTNVVKALNDAIDQATNTLTNSDDLNNVAKANDDLTKAIAKAKLDHVINQASDDLAHKLNNLTPEQNQALTDAINNANNVSNNANSSTDQLNNSANNLEHSLAKAKAQDAINNANKVIDQINNDINNLPANDQEAIKQLTNNLKDQIDQTSNDLTNNANNSTLNNDAAKLNNDSANALVHSAIIKANSFKNSLKDNYPTITKDLDKAINDADQVVSDAHSSDEAKINASNNLNNEVKKYQATKDLEDAKNALNNSLNDAKALKDAIDNSNLPDNVKQDLNNALNPIIQNNQNNLDNATINNTTSVNDIKQLTNKLKDNKQDLDDKLSKIKDQFNNQSVFNDAKNKLQDAIKYANDVKDSITRNNDPVIADNTNIANSLKDAIDQANNTLDNSNNLVPNANNANDLTKVADNLINQANKDKLNSTINRAKEVINDDLKDLNNPVFDKIKQDLTNSINDATNVLNDPNSSNDALTKATSDLNNAINDAINKITQEKNHLLKEARDKLANTIKKSQDATQGITDPKVLGNLPNTIKKANDILNNPNNPLANNTNAINKMINKIIDQTKQALDNQDKKVFDTNAKDLQDSINQANNIINSLNNNPDKDKILGNLPNVLNNANQVNDQIQNKTLTPSDNDSIQNTINDLNNAINKALNNEAKNKLEKALVDANKALKQIEPFSKAAKELQSTVDNAKDVLNNPNSSTKTLNKTADDLINTTKKDLLINAREKLQDLINQAKKLITDANGNNEIIGLLPFAIADSNKVLTSSNDLDQLNNSINDLSKAYDKSLNTLNEHDQLTNDLDQLINHAKDLIATLGNDKSVILNLPLATENAIKVISNNNNTIQELKDSIKNLKDALEQTQKAFNGLVNDIDQANNEINKLNNLAPSLKDEFKNQVAKALDQAQIDQIVAKAKGLDQDYQALKDAINKAIDFTNSNKFRFAKPSLKNKLRDLIDSATIDNITNNNYQGLIDSPEIVKDLTDRINQTIDQFSSIDATNGGWWMVIFGILGTTAYWAGVILGFKKRKKKQDQ